MDALYAFGRRLFPLSFLLYVGLHFGKPEVGAGFIPSFIPFPLALNYITAVCLLAFIVSCMIGKYDRLATQLMVVYVFLVTILVHIPRAAAPVAPVTMTGGEMDMVNVFRNVMVIGALLVFAKTSTKDVRGALGLKGTDPSCWPAL
jgi:uncharacterized membrane protein